jgi:hypothetical protein
MAKTRAKKPNQERTQRRTKDLPMRDKGSPVKGGIIIDFKQF